MHHTQKAGQPGTTLRGRTTGARGGPALRLLAMAGALALALMLVLLPGWAGQDRYDYDPLGRLVRHADNAAQAIDYTYDPAGNILAVARAQAGAAVPQLQSLSPAVWRKGESGPVTLQGLGLQSGTLQADHPGLVLSQLQQSTTRIDAQLAVAPAVPVGPHILRFSNAGGTAQATLQIAPALPTLSVEPDPLALPPDATPRAITLRLSHADLVAHTVTVTASDPGRATVSPAQVVFAPGQTSAQVSVKPLRAGFLQLTLSSPLLATRVLPVFITTDFRGVNTSIAQPVGVVVGQAEPTAPPAQVPATFAASQVGVSLGSVITSLSPGGLAAGATQAFTLRGRALPPGLRVALLPGEGLTVSVDASSAEQIALRLTAEPGAAPGLRRLTLVDAQGRTVPFADPAQSLLRVTTGQPVLHAIEPLHAVPGTTVQLLLRGRHLQEGRVQVLPSTDLRVDAQPSVDAEGTQVLARIQLSPLAALGPRTVQVTTPSGATAAEASSGNQLQVVSEIRHAVTPIASQAVGVQVGAAGGGAGRGAPGTLASSLVGLSVGPAAFQVSPSTGVRGTTLTLVVSGSGLQSVESATLLPADGIVAGPLSVDPDGKRLLLPLAIDAQAPRTLRRLVMRTPAGALPLAAPQGDQFLVVAPSPVLTAITPQVLKAGTTATLTVRGQHFTDLQDLRFEPPLGLALAGNPVAEDSGTRLSVPVRADTSATSGPRLLVVRTAGGESSSTATPANTFQVARELGPTLADILSRPVGVSVGASTPAASTVTQAAYSDAVGVVLTPQRIEQRETLTPFAAPVGVVVGAAVAGVGPASPDGLPKGGAGSLRITGYGLPADLAVSILGRPGVSAGVPAIDADGRALSLPVTVTEDAPAGSYGLRLTAGNGAAAQRLTAVQPGALFFSVGVLPLAIDSVGPIVLEQGKAYTLTVRGSRLQDVFEVLAEPAAGLQVGEAFATPIWSTDALGEKLSVPVQVTADAPLGPRVLRLRVPGGITAAEPMPANTVTVVTPQ